MRKRKEGAEVGQRPSLTREHRRILPEEWRAYGFWARPRIGTVMVHNATPPSSPYPSFTNMQIEHIMRGVQGPDGTECPERWVPRLEHTSLPPRPALWSTPPSTPSTPNALSLQLNPFLEHRRTGVPPMTFDIRFMLPSIILGETADPDSKYVMFNAEGPNGAQPATYPGVGALSITALADDMVLAFPWPVIAVARHAALPVTVRDVCDAVYQNFQEFMMKEELDALSKQRRGQVMRAYEERVRDLPHTTREDGVRRVDFLGDRCVFRGLEPTADGEGFVMFVGPPQ
ncbi:hypothetical protein BDW22DRAFT_1338605 [Trametopsis cervina]|nr:hypothetical protein BDW22DRAFT_1338605 [Trametopsis cervina]